MIRFTNPSAREANKQKGMSNIMIGIVLMVGVIIVFAGIKMFPKIGDAKVNNEIESLGNLKTKVVDYGQYTPVFTSGNTSTAVLNGLGFFDPNTVTGTGANMTATSQWNGTITPSVGTVNTAGDSIVFTVTGYSQSACNQIGLKVDQIADIVAINGTTTKAAGASSAAAAVNAACTSNNNSIAYTLAK